MKTQILSLFCSSLLLAHLASAQNQKGDEAEKLKKVEVVERIVAFVNRDIITLGEFEAEFSLHAKRLGLTSAQASEKKWRLKVLNTMIDNKLILQRAANEGLRVPEKYFENWKKNIIKENHLQDEAELIKKVEEEGSSMDKLRKKFMDSVLIQEIINRVVRKKVHISEEDVQNFYQEKKEELTLPETIRIQEITIFIENQKVEEARERIQKIRSLIESGLEFTEVAKVHSESQSKSVGGDLGFFSFQELEDHFKTIFENLKVGELSEIIEKNQAFNLFTIIEKKGGAPVPLSEVREQLTQMIFAEKKSSVIADFLSELREKAIVEIRL